MKTNKKLLLATISSLAIVGSANAVNLDTGTGTAIYASEIVMPANLGNMAAPGQLQVVGEIGIGLSNIETHYIRYDLPTGVTWDTAVLGTDLTIGVLPPAPTIVVSSGGTPLDTYVVFSVSAAPAGTGIPSNSVVTFQLNAAGLDTLPDQSPIVVTYTAYGNDTAASTGDPTALGPVLYSRSGVLLSFADALSMRCTPAEGGILLGDDDIDVAQGSNFFDGALTSDPDTFLGVFELGEQNTVLNIAGVAMTVPGTALNTIVASANMTVTANNGWSAIDTLNDGTGIFVGSPNKTPAGVFSVNGIPSGFVGGLADFLLPSIFTASVPVANTTAIVPTSAFMGVTPTSALGYDASTIAKSCLLGHIDRNGSHDRLTFALTPGGAYRNFVRITNPSSTAGAVFLTVYDDAGRAANFALSDVNDINGPAASGAQPASLVAQASTMLLDIVDIAAAAQIANPLLDITNKLRINVDAEFGNSYIVNALDIDSVNDETGVNIQAFSMSTDGNSFFMMQKD